MNDRLSNRLDSEAPAQSISRRRFLRSVVAAGTGIAGFVMMEGRALAVNCGANTCTPSNTCNPNECGPNDCTAGGNTCTPGSNSCSVSNSCSPNNTCAASNTCGDGNTGSCTAQGNTCNSNYCSGTAGNTCNYNVCTGNECRTPNTCQFANNCSPNKCKPNNCSAQHTCSGADLECALFDWNCIFNESLAPSQEEPHAQWMSLDTFRKLTEPVADDLAELT
jgi:hypothetical protein